MLKLFGSVLLLGLLIMTGWVYTFGLNIAHQEPHKAELQFASYSMITGNTGGAVVPASCESSPQYPHFTGECNAIPVTPSGLTAICTAGTGLLNWSQPADWGSPATNLRYLVEVVNTQNGASWTPTKTGATNTSHSFGNGALVGRDYRWSVRACNSVGCSAPAIGTNFSCVTAPTPPQNLQVQCLYNRARFDWVAPTSWGYPQSNLRFNFFQRDTANGVEYFQQLGSGAFNRGSYFDSVNTDRVVQGRDYTWWMQACNQLDNCSAIVPGPTFNCPAPGITNFNHTCSADGQSLNASWGTVSGAVAYKLSLEGSVQSECGVGWTWENNRCKYTVNTTSATVDLNPGNTHNLFIEAVNGSGQVIASQRFDALMCPLPTTLTLQKPVCVDDGSGVTGTVTLKWNQVGGATSYRPRVRDLANNTTPTELCPNGKYSGMDRWCWNGRTTSTNPPIAINGGEVSFTFTGAPLGKTYTWWLHADDASGNELAYKTATAAENFKCELPSPVVGGGGSAPSVTLEVDPGTGSYTDSNVSIVAGTNIKLSWSTTDSPTSCTASANPSDTEFSGSVAVNGGEDSTVTEPVEGSSTTYTVTCTNADGAGSDSITVSTIGTQVSAPTAALRIKAQPPLIRQGQDSALTWDITAPYVMSCNITGTGVNVQNYNHTGTSANPNSSGNTSTPELYNSSTYTLACTPTDPMFKSEIQRTSVRVEVVPDYQEP